MNLPVYDIVYDEGVFVGYRWYESKKVDPLYPFGFGLSYTQFEYDNLKLSASEIDRGEKLAVEFKVKNMGKIAGAEIAQLYVQDQEASVPRPIKELKGFKKVFLNAGESKKIKLVLDDNAFAFWDVESHNWKIEEGKYNILVGSSSKNIKLSKEMEIK